MTARVTDSLAPGVEVLDVSQPEAAPAHRREAAPPFRDVYEAHVEMVFRTLRRVGVPAAAVDDVAQEVFLAVHRALPTWEGRASLRTWVYRIAKNAGLNHARGLRRRPDGALTDTADATAHGDLDPEERAANNEALGELVRLLDQLDANKREVLVLMELEGFSAPETAELLNVPLNTVYSRLRLARAELERLIALPDGTTRCSATRTEASS